MLTHRKGPTEAKVTSISKSSDGWRVQLAVPFQSSVVLPVSYEEAGKLEVGQVLRIREEGSPYDDTLRIELCRPLTRVVKHRDTYEVL